MLIFSGARVMIENATLKAKLKYKQVSNPLLQNSSLMRMLGFPVTQYGLRSLYTF
jgi:hypothetical protein